MRNLWTLQVKTRTELFVLLDGRVGEALSKVVQFCVEPPDFLLEQRDVPPIVEIDGCMVADALGPGGKLECADSFRSTEE